MKTKETLSMYKYAKACKVTPSTIYNRVKTGELILDKNKQVPKGTLIVEKLKLGRPLEC